MKFIAIIGGGACGSAAFIELVIQICSLGLQEKLGIILIERRKKFGYGMAFSSKEKSHLLNTQSELMGIYAHEPKHFTKWLQSDNGKHRGKIRGERDTSSAYTSRILYGDYVSEQLEKYVQKAKEAHVQVKLINDEAVDIHRQENEELKIDLKSSGSLVADYALIAPGTPKPNKYKELREYDAYIDFPWPTRRIKKKVHQDDEVAVLGSSLSAIDSVLTLVNNGHRGQITLYSPTGMLPRVQPPKNKEVTRKHLRLENIHQINRTKMRRPRVKELFRLYKKDVEEAEGKQLDWKKLDRSAQSTKELLKYDINAAENGGDTLLSITYSLRYDASVMWEWLSHEEKKKFKKWLGSHWMINRHAMPLHNAKKLMRLFESGQLQVIPKISEVKFDEDKKKFRVQTEQGVYDADKLINATGTASRLKGMDSRLINHLLKKEYLTPYPAGGALINPRTMQAISEKGGENIYAVGHLVNGMLLDVDAVWFNVRTVNNFVSEIIFKAREDGYIS